VTSAVATYLQIALGILGIPIVVATGWAVVLSFRRSWGRARKIARTSFGLSVLVLSLAWFAIPMFVVRHMIVEDAGADASSKARALAEAISEGMNCTAFVLLSAPITFGTWVLAAWRVRKTEAPPPA
jgi:hypothetical protein